MISNIFRSKHIWLLFIGLLAFLVAFPKPTLFFRTMQRLVQPPIAPEQVAEISAILPNDPAQIETWVFVHITRDANDYANWGVIFYLASPEEVLILRRGPCYARAIVLASILQAKGLPFQFYYMPGHIWVDYPHRQPYIWEPGYEWIERPQHAIFRWEAGRWYWQGFGWVRVLPAMLRIQFELYWRIIPLVGKVIFLLGLALVVVMMTKKGWQPVHRFTD